jgi:hypothetical protein
MHSAPCRRRSLILVTVILASRMALSPAAFAQTPPSQPSTQPGSGSATTAHAFVEYSDARVHFISEQRNVNLFMREEDQFGEEYFDPICTAPCETSLPTGSHRMALSRGARPPILLPYMARTSAVEADKPVVLLGPSTLKGTYRSRTGLRVLFWVLAIAMGLGAGPLLEAGLLHTESACTGNPQSCTSFRKEDWGLITAAAILGGGAISFAIAPLFIHDGATIDVDISLSPILLPRRFALQEMSFLNEGHGVSIGMKF